jgi:hypothetical protein
MQQQPSRAGLIAPPNSSPLQNQWQSCIPHSTSNVAHHMPGRHVHAKKPVSHLPSLLGTHKGVTHTGTRGHLNVH